jgi:dipeptidyl-peptidase-4
MRTASALLLAQLLLVSTAVPRDIRAEIDEARRFGARASELITQDKLSCYWAGDGSALVYRVNTGGTTQRFFQVDLKTGAKYPAFDHDAMAAALAKASSKKVRAASLPIESLKPGPAGGVMRFRAFGTDWSFDPAKNLVTPDETPPESATLMAPQDAVRAAQRGSSERTILTFENGTTGDIELFWAQDRRQRKSYGRIAAGKRSTQSTYSGHVWIITDASGKDLVGVVTPQDPAVARVTGRIAAKRKRRDNLSPDGKWTATIQNHNLAIVPASGGEPDLLSADGTPGDPYSGPFQWSPDSNKLVAWKAKDVKPRQIHIVQSSPPDQVQPKLLTIDYPKPGDPIRQPKPRLFDITQRKQLPIDDTLFNNPWSISNSAWNHESSEFSFIYNQRGHQVMRLLGVSADTGSVRTIVDERSDTFIDYSQKTWLHRLPETHELIWASERDGYNHLYLIDEPTGQVKNLITCGNWIVREVVEVDDAKRVLMLKILGLPGEDPYNEQFIRINFDGSGFTRLTHGDGRHSIKFSPDHQTFVDTWSRVDLPPVTELRRTEDGKLIAELERADDSALRKTGWSRPERFTAKGRDGTTDIHGIIVRPSHFDSSKKYPVVEQIYAGPHDHFVPNRYFAWSGMNAMAELGFVIVSIDGMGTNWRSKAFHDVCWKNLADAGFPDRIPWIKAAAATRPWMDLTRVGIYGGSAGGQNALSGLLNHGDFYQVGVADCGCHDNRMDKIWWNEAWMGWPVDDSYARNSNVTHAGQLTGKLLLIVGETDHNVDPASTAQVIAALEEADKDFEFLPIMNSDHGAAESRYGNYRRADFLVRHLQDSSASTTR